MIVLWFRQYSEQNEVETVSEEIILIKKLFYYTS